MDFTDIPARFPIPFAFAAGPGFTRPIPTASQIGIQNGAASLTDGFPPDCFIPDVSGGAPPFGADFNGLLNQVTLWSQWEAAGGPVGYDATFAMAIGGYPINAILASNTTPGKFWLNTVDDNTSNPDTGGSNWSAFTPTAVVPSSRNVFTVNGLQGGGSLAADLTLSPVYGTAANTVAQGNDSRIVNAAQLNAANTFSASPQTLTTATFSSFVSKTTSAAAYAQFEALNDSTGSLQCLQAGTALAGSTFGFSNPGLALVLASGGTGLAIGTVDSTPMVLGTNDTAQLKFTAGGGLTSPGVTGGDQGANTLNFGALYQGGVLTVTTARQVIAGTGLSGGGALSSDVTLSVVYGTVVGTAAQGNDSRIVNAAQVNASNTFSLQQSIITNTVNTFLVKSTNSSQFPTVETSNDSTGVAEVLVGGTTAAGTTFGLSNAGLAQFVAGGATGAIFGTVDNEHAYFGSDNTPQLKATSGGGLSYPGVTGGDKGANTLNVGTLYQNNVLVVTTARNVNTSNGLQGGGNLSTDLTLSPVYGTAANTVAQGNDSRIVNALQSGNNLSDVASAATSRANLGFTSYRTSSYTPTAATQQSEAHSLGALPNIFSVEVWLQNVTAESGYSTGDMVKCPQGGNSRNDGVTAWVNGTNVGFSIGNNGAWVTPKNSGNVSAPITAGNWLIFVILKYNA